MAKSEEKPDAQAKPVLQPASQSAPEVVAAPTGAPSPEIQEESQPKPRSSPPIWLTALFFLGLLAVLFWVLYKGFGNSELESANSQLATPVAGGMVVQATAAPATTAAAGGEAAKPAGLQPGQTVAANAPEGLRLYADATSSSPIRDVYTAGALFTLLESSDKYKEYPVSLDNHQWYRLRAADGLVGWAMMDAFTPVKTAPKPTSTSAG
jgi:hypothetical protein